MGSHQHHRESSKTKTTVDSSPVVLSYTETSDSIEECVECSERHSHQKEMLIRLVTSARLEKMFQQFILIYTRSRQFLIYLNQPWYYAQLCSIFVSCGEEHSLGKQRVSHEGTNTPVSIGSQYWVVKRTIAQIAKRSVFVPVLGRQVDRQFLPVSVYFEVIGAFSAAESIEDLEKETKEQEQQRHQTSFKLRTFVS